MQFLISNSDVSIPNAIKFNTHFRDHLIQLRTKLEELRDDCKKRYQENIKKLEALNSNNVTRNTGRFNNFYCTGQPYFKTRTYFSAKPNEDYFYRRNVNRELFPMDILGTNTWTSNDKALLLFGIKQQIVMFLILNNKTNIGKNEKTNYKQPISDLVNLIEGSTFKIDWNKISFDVLKERHTIPECICMWNSCLHPQLRRTQWTHSEDVSLVKSATHYNFQNWTEIAKAVPNRSSFQCFLRYEIALSESSRTKNTKWTKEEDDLLISLIDKYRVGQSIPWIKIAELIPNRNQTQVYQRWVFTVKPDIKRGRFTKEEDCILMAAIIQYGNISDLPSNILPGRTAQQVRHRYNNVLKFAGKISDWTLEQDHDLMRLVEEKGRDQWSEIAKIIGGHTRQSCRQRYLTLQKFLEKNPNCKVDDAPRKKRNREGHVNPDNWFECYVSELNSDAQLGGDVHQKKKPEKDFYKNLTIIKQIYFDFFKTSFNFQYGAAPKTTTTTVNMGIFLSNFLNYRSKSIEDIPNDNYSRLTEFEKTIMGYNRVDETKGNGGIKFAPPNLSTLLLTRGLSLTFHPQRILEERRGRRRHAIKQESSPAYALFKSRLKSLILMPLLLSKLPFKCIKQSMDNLKNGNANNEEECEVITDEANEQFVDIKTQLDDSFSCRININGNNGKRILDNTNTNVITQPPLKKAKLEQI